MDGYTFNTPPGWPVPPPCWEPPAGWTPDPSWPPAPVGWVFWTQTPAPPPAPPDPSELHNESVPLLTDSSETPADTANVDVPCDPAPHGQVAQLREELAAENARVEQLTAQVTQPREQVAATQTSVADDSIGDVEALRAQLIELNDAVVLQQVGIYEYHHRLEDAAAYKTRLDDLRQRIRECVTGGDAVEASDMFAYNNSVAQGRRMVADFSKLLLRAYNAEADNCVRSLRAGTLATAVKRLNASAEAIAKLGSMMQLRVSPAYHQLRTEELELVADYLYKQQEEKEAAREERERLREEKQAERELAAQREKLDKERAHYVNALAAVATQEGADAGELQAQLARIDEAIALNDYRIANIRAGYVYVISNIGSFGPNVVKIGLTRRLDPMDRIRELGDASVPFRFDVHALYFSKDAVTLENELHEQFSALRVNQVNPRREFFFATPTQVRDILAAKVGNLLEFTDEPEASEYFQSSRYWPEAQTGPGRHGPATY